MRFPFPRLEFRWVDKITLWQKCEGVYKEHLGVLESDPDEASRTKYSIYQYTGLNFSANFFCGQAKAAANSWFKRKKVATVFSTEREEHETTVYVRFLVDPPL